MEKQGYYVAGLASQNPALDYVFAKKSLFNNKKV